MIGICPRCKATNHCNSDSDYKCRKCSNTVKAIPKVVAKVVATKKMKLKKQFITGLPEPMGNFTAEEWEDLQIEREKEIKENDTREE